MRTPSAKDLPDALYTATCDVARKLQGAGHRGWLVGGAVRDLALGRAPVDVDLATAARPGAIEALFERTAAVGKAFGTMLVLDAGVEVQVTTFRAERGYSDGRHPDEVRFAETLEEDARRRDFTCNALYLDPLTDELADPEGGVADLERGVLACIGVAEERFREDGLRLLRLARFHAGLGLEVAPETEAAAKASLDALRGVSVERTHGELSRIVAGPTPWRALGLLDRLGALQRVLPGWEARAERWRPALERLEGSARAWMAALAGLDVGNLEALRAPKAIAEATVRIRATVDALERGRLGARPDTLRAVRAEEWPDVLTIARAVGGEIASRASDLEALRASCSSSDLSPTPLLTAEDLRRAGVAPGPRFGAILRELETRQLSGELRSRDAALAWLARVDD